MKQTCIVLLSDKSSGSTILQKIITSHPQIKNIRSDLNNYESKYWEYATAILGLEQPKMKYSHEFPISRKKALQRIDKLLKQDAGLNIDIRNFSDAKEYIFNGWEALCEKYSPVFFEKSPHHLHYKEALNLMYEYIQKYPNTDFKFIGLVRNPIDTLYSMWKRWYAIPEQRQYEWLRAYNNLLDFKFKLNEYLKIVKYEDLVKNPEELRDLFNFIGVNYSPELETNLHNRSLNKWKNDKNFAFHLSQEVFELAKKFYSTEKLQNENKNIVYWQILSKLNKPSFRLLVTKGSLKRFMKKLKYYLKS